VLPQTEPCIIAMTGAGKLRTARRRRSSGSEYANGSCPSFPLDSITGLRAAHLGYGGWVQLSPAVLFGRPLSLLDAIERFRVGRVSMTSSMAARVLTAGDDSGSRADLTHHAEPPA
jgi:hypothetical protein